MIVERRTYSVNLGSTQDLVNLIKEEMRALGGNVVSRIYRPIAAPLDLVVHEMQFEDMAEREEFWAKWTDERATPAFWEKWHKLHRPGGHVEFWRLEE
jgi:hypothetical protein